MIQRREIVANIQIEFRNEFIGNQTLGVVAIVDDTIGQSRDGYLGEDITVLIRLDNGLIIALEFQCLATNIDRGDWIDLDFIGTRNSSDRRDTGSGLGETEHETKDITGHKIKCDRDVKRTRRDHEIRHLASLGIVDEREICGGQWRACSGADVGDERSDQLSQ